MAKYQDIDPSDPDIQKQLDHLSRNPIPRKEEDSLSTKHHLSSKHKRKNQKKYYFEELVDYEVDLHGFTLEEIEFELMNAFEICERSGYNKFRIIHGGTLQRMVPIKKEINRLLKTKFKRRFTRRYYEPHNQGATIILIQEL